MLTCYVGNPLRPKGTTSSSYPHGNIMHHSPNQLEVNNELHYGFRALLLERVELFPPLWFVEFQVK